MKKVGKWLLVAGVVLYALGHLSNVALFVWNYSVITGGPAVAAFNAEYVGNSVFYFLLMLCWAGALPVWALVNHLRQKRSKKLMIATIVLASLLLAVELFFELSTAIQRYIVMSALGVVDTYVTILFQYLNSGVLPYLLGSICTIIGCAFLLRDKRVKVEETL